MKIRSARFEDLDVLVEHGKTFYESTKYHQDGIPYSPVDVNNLTHMLIEDSNGVVLVLEDGGKVVGFVLMILSPAPYLSNVVIATELAYYVGDAYRKGGHGIKLLEQAEKVCKLMGADYVNMISMEACLPRQAEALYEKLGYERTETSYIKEL